MVHRKCPKEFSSIVPIKSVCEKKVILINSHFIKELNFKKDVYLLEVFGIRYNELIRCVIIVLSVIVICCQMAFIIPIN